MAAKKKAASKESGYTKERESIEKAISIMDPRGTGHVPSGTSSQFQDALEVLKEAVAED